MATKRHIADLWATRKIAEHPGALDLVNVFERSWPEWCGFPMAATYAILTNGTDDPIAAKKMLVQMGVEELPALTSL